MVVLQVTHQVLPNHVEHYIEATLANARSTRQEPGNLRFDVLRNAADPYSFQLYEAYIDRDAQQAHLSSAHFLAWKEAVQHVVTDRSVQKFEALHIA